MNLKELKTELLCRGARIEDNPDRTGGAGPSDASFISIDRSTISVPVSGKYVKNSPYSFKRENGNWMLFYNSNCLGEVKRIKKPNFYNYRTSDGIPYNKIFIAHGDDCIGTTVFQSCCYWNTPQGCKFCGIGLSMRGGQTIPVKTPEQLYMVARSAVDENFTHSVLTTGSQRDEKKMFNHLAECIKILKQLPLKIQVQISPPSDLSLLEILKNSGCDTVAINVESLDRDVLRNLAPQKFRMGVQKYLKCMEYGVSIFGKNQIVSFILAGLGEDVDETIRGAKLLTSMGVYPFVVPFRPIPGTALEDLPPPEPAYLREIITAISGFLKEYSITYKKIYAGCGRCTCCSPLPEYELQ